MAHEGTADTSTAEQVQNTAAASCKTVWPHVCMDVLLFCYTLHPPTPGVPLGSVH